jgi:hypothetical protein
MPSPFPGMNPYFEQPGLWRGFHTTFLVSLRAALVPLVRPKYFVEVEESVYIDPTGDEPRLFAVADAAVIKPNANGSAGSTAVAVVAAPVTVRVPGVTTRKARRLVIRDGKSQDVVTVIEVLSPSNKVGGADRDKYLEKRNEVLTSAAHFVELDLLRGGRRMPLRPPPAGDYYALVSRAWQRPDMGLWPFGLRDPLPAIPIPLRPGEPEPLLDLKPILDRAYDEAGYEDRIYRTPPDPPLSPADAEWAAGFVPKPAAAPPT